MKTPGRSEWIRLALRLAAGLAVPAFAVSAAPAAAQKAEVDPQRQALGVELASLLNSEALMRAQMTTMLDKTLPTAFAADPGLVSLEKDYPGITKAMLGAMAPILAESGVKDLPALWGELGTIFAGAMPAADLRTTIDFYRSPTGMRVLALAGELADFSTVLGAAVKDPDAVISTGDLRADTLKTDSAVKARLTPAEAEAVRRFERSFPGLQLALVLPAIQAKLAEWGDRPDPEADVRIEAAMTEIVAKYSLEADTK